MSGCTTLRRSAQVERRADEHVLGSFADEGVDQLLRGGAVDLVWPAGAAQPAVEARVVDVGVEPVLVRRMADARRSAARSRRRAGVRGRRPAPAARPGGGPRGRRARAGAVAQQPARCPSGASCGCRRASGSDPTSRSRRRRPAARGRRPGGPSRAARPRVTARAARGSGVATGGGGVGVAVAGRRRRRRAAAAAAGEPPRRRQSRPAARRAARGRSERATAERGARSRYGERRRPSPVIWAACSQDRLKLTAPVSERARHLAGLGGYEAGLRELVCDGVDRDVAIEADADDDAGAPDGEVVGHRELLGRGAGHAQLAPRRRPPRRRPRPRRARPDRGGGRVHHHDDPPLRCGRGRLEPTERRRAPRARRSGENDGSYE